MSENIRLEVGEESNFSVKARCYFGGHKPISVLEGERYLIKIDSNDKWVDMVVRCNAEGFNNWFAKGDRLRVAEAICFCLCGVIDKREGGFKIGLTPELEVPESGELSFFANDHPRFYWNNFGKIKLKIIRLE